MGRSERSLGNGETPAEIFAAELRRLRERAGNPTYLKMHRACGKIRSKTALSEAAGGDHLPTWETVEAYASALGADPAAWRRRWEEAQDQERCRREGGAVLAVAEQARPAPENENVPTRRYLAGPLKLPRPSVRVLVIAVTAAGVAGALSILMVTRGDRALVQTGPAAVVVQNKVAIGPRTLMEDSTPEYLSTKPVPRCAERGCEVPGTTMWSGTIIPVVCQMTGEWMTNADLVSKGIAENPGRASSTLWYRAVFPDGKAGDIPAVYLGARYRGGMHLPRCH
jgi:Helix-turn-helix domain